MTNKEILQANLLDILFDGRNKEYGAYAIRRGYNHRMLLALGLGLSVILLLLLANSCHMSDSKKQLDQEENGYKLTAVELPQVKMPEQPKPKPVQSKPVEPTATIRDVVPRIVPDILVDHTDVPDNADIGDKAIGNTNTDGPPAGMNTGNTGGSGDGNTVTTVTDVLPPAPSFPPEFPGGMKALQDFLGKNLATPDNLEPGEKKIVKARFMVDKDGSVSTVEIEVSGGNTYDREVIRVCKRMPKWRPALQNGHPVAISYVLPVTFIGVEQ